MKYLHLLSLYLLVWFLPLGLTTVTYPNCTGCCASTNCGPTFCNIDSTVTTTLHATLAGYNAGFGTTCTNVSGTIALTSGGAGVWTGTGPFGTTGHNIKITFQCSPLQITFNFPDGCGVQNCVNPSGVSGCGNNISFNNNCTSPDVHGVGTALTGGGLASCGCTGGSGASFQVDITL